VITQQSEAKFNEMKKNFENLRQNNEHLNSDLQELRRRELQVIINSIELDPPSIPFNETIIDM
jgi:hypothetical protein